MNIDANHENTPDKAEYEGHYYSDKAPGTVVLALPAFTMTTIALQVFGVGTDSDVGWQLSSWVACLVSIAIPGSIGGGLLFTWLCKHVSASSALVTTLALFLGAAPLPYATMMFSHALVVGLIAIALWSISKCRAQREVRGLSSPKCKTPGCEALSAECAHGRRWFGAKHWMKTNRWDLLAGFACGWALASEYTAGIVVVGLFVWLVLHGWRRAIPFCLAAILPLLLIPLYSLLCFGTPFILPYTLNESFPEMKEGLYAIKWPNLETGYDLLLSPTRGLFFWTPFLAVALFGYGRLALINERLVWLTYVVPVVQVVAISGRSWDWMAGPSFGPRYLAPIVPLLALPCALGVQRFPKLGMCMAAYSILITTLATLTDACPPCNYYNPLTELHIPLLLKGELSPNLGMGLGLPAYASVALFYAILIGGIWLLWRKLPRNGEVAALNDVQTRDAQRA